MSIESIVNQSIDLIGYKRHIGSIWDGSPAARIALNAYAETRDEVLAMAPWDFARDFLWLEPETQTLPPTWLYAFKRPDSAITVLDVFPTILDRLEPRPSVWVEATSPTRTIFTRFTGAGAAITNRITDTELWSPEFTMAVIRGLAEKFQHALIGAPVKEADGESRGHRQ